MSQSQEVIRDQVWKVETCKSRSLALNGKESRPPDGGPFPSPKRRTVDVASIHGERHQAFRPRAVAPALSVRHSTSKTPS